MSDTGTMSDAARLARSLDRESLAQDLIEDQDAELGRLRDQRAEHRRELKAALTEVERLRALWPTNGLDTDTNVHQLVANHRAWTKQAREEASQLRAQRDAALALIKEANLRSDWAQRMRRALGDTDE